MDIYNASIRSQQALFGVGLALAAIYGFSFVFLLDFLPPPHPSLGVDEVVDLYAHSNTKFRCGVVLMIASGAFYLPMSITIGLQMARVEKGFPIWATTQALASTVGAWIFAFPPVLWGVAAFNVDRSPEITLALHQLAWLVFVAPGSFFPFQLVPIAVVCLTADGTENSPFSRIFGWFTLFACALAFDPTLVPLFNHGPFSWSGVICWWLAIVAYTSWIIVLSICVLRALGRQKQSSAIQSGVSA